MDGPYEIDPVPAASLDEFADVACFILRIWQTPVRTAVIRIVLRTVQITIHLVLSVEIYEGKPYFM